MDNHFRKRRLLNKPIFLIWKTFVVAIKHSNVVKIEIQLQCWFESFSYAAHLQVLDSNLIKLFDFDAFIS